MRVLLLAFHYPPIGGSGPARTAALARLLRERGWEPVVLTIDRWPSALRDPSIPHEPAAIRVAAPDPALLLAPLRMLRLHRLAARIERLIVPDRAILWALAALPAAVRAARSCDAILSSSPPESAHLLAAAVARIAHRPWVADLRTEWSEYPGRTFLRLHRALERALLPRAARVVTLNDEHTARVRELGARAETLVAGWDPAEAQSPELPPPRRPAVVAYAGVFSDARTIDPFLDAAERLPAGTLELRVFGSPWSARDRLARTTVPVHLAGRLPRSAIPGALRKADWLLVTLDARATRWIPNKVYEYAAVGRPILAFVPGEGATARWVRETGAGFVLPSDRPEEAARGLAELFERWNAGRLEWRPERARLEEDSLPRVGERLDRILRDAAPARPARQRPVEVGVFLTLGFSLRSWREHGILRRELALYERLAARGWRFHLFTYDPPGPPPEELPPGIRIHAAPAAWWVAGPRRVALYSLLLPLVHARALRRVRILKTGQMRGAYAAVLAKLLHGARHINRTGYVLSIFDRELRRPDWVRALGVLTERLAYSFADASVTTTEVQRDYVVRSYRPRRGCAVIPNGIDTRQFRPLDLPKRPRSVIFVGRLEPQKNLEALIDALSGVEAELTLVGEGSLRGRLEAHAGSLGVPVRFLGTVPNEALPPLLCGHEVFALPSRFEGFPKALAEAMACGTAVVAQGYPGAREIIRPEGNGLLCSVDPASIRAAIERLLEDPGLRAELGAAARASAEARFSLDRVADAESGLLSRLSPPRRISPVFGHPPA